MAPRPVRGRQNNRSPHHRTIPPNVHAPRHKMWSRFRIKINQDYSGRSRTLKKVLGWDFQTMLESLHTLSFTRCSTMNGLASRFQGVVTFGTQCKQYLVAVFAVIGDFRQLIKHKHGCGVDDCVFFSLEIVDVAAKSGLSPAPNSTIQLFENGAWYMSFAQQSRFLCGFLSESP